MLEEYSLIFYPDNYIEQYISSPKDMYENRFLLRQIRFTSTSYKYITKAVIGAINDKSKIRTLQRLVMLKTILFSREVIEVEKDIIDMLFRLFQHYIFSEGTQLDAEIKRQANNLIRSHQLDEAQVRWLIENYQRSEHILNRLLRYPGFNKRVTDWARIMYDSRELPQRTAEVLGLLITDTLPEFSVDEDIKTVLWAIYYSRNTSETKRSLILGVVNRKNVESCITSVYDIAGRMNCYCIMEELLQKYR